VENKARELLDIGDEVFERDEFEEGIYPKRLKPTDIVRYIDGAEKQLEEADRLREKRKKVFAPREEMLLDAMARIKKLEAIRVAQKIAEMQRLAIAGKTIEELNAEREERRKKILEGPPPTPEEIEEQRIQAELEAARTLQGFDKNIVTLTDEAAELTSENPDAAAAIIRQWIGNPEQITND
jgi:flagellar biosynthesis/type III secretory pathway M-ring protein FliF/YscJ